MSDLRRVMRVLKEDDDFLTVEIAKSLDTDMFIGPIGGVEQNARFYTFIFTRMVDGKIVAWDPFAKGSR